MVKYALLNELQNKIIIISSDFIFQLYLLVFLKARVEVIILTIFAPDSKSNCLYHEQILFHPHFSNLAS